jgi:hypothetical protein
MILAVLAAAALDLGLEDYAATAAGVFSSIRQHQSDPAYDEVQVRVVRIWPERDDALWLYQEQAIANQPGKTREQALASPYFQFVARVVPLGDGTYRRDNYRVKDPGRFAGANVQTLTGTDLMEASCHNRIERIARDWYVARTESCANRYKGAAAMQSRSIVTRNAYVNWDRGFDLDGRPVWGPKEGGYVFERQGAP